MADHNDEIMRALAHSISVVYTLLVDVCRLLPVPIELPTDQHIPATEAVPAVRRVADLAKDQPMGEMQEAQLFTGCIHFLAAIDLYGLCATTWVDARADGAAANLLYAREALVNLEAWLVINQAD
ncbi:hypothetical protein [Streptomyces huasconensis]|uniref:hypothetical protein n=1 Tax=Streptomyces huasconensis TaxID=1854574 RepID=UPI0037030F55